ncbi:MAG: NAD-dependent epimerase/dehydratase family protein [Dehalococcoidia bacterium]
MRVLLTGGAGFIGSHIAEAYLDAGHEVTIVDDLSTGRREHVPPSAELVECSIRDASLADVFERVRPEVVNHHAAQASVKLSTGDPIADLATNGGGTAAVAMLAARYGARKIIYASSGGTVYGNPERLPVSEDHALAPVSPYGTSKLAGELYVRMFGRTAGLDFTIFRYGNAYGPRQDPHGEAGVVAIFTGLMLQGQRCTIDGDGEQRKDYLYVGDIARANVLALESGSGQTLNIGTGEGLTVNEIFRTLSAETGNRVAAANGPPRPGDVRDFWLDCDRAASVLGWRAATSFEDGVRLTVASFG